jgi:multicomponent Na+:H+ antiporter subunit E
VLGFAVLLVLRRGLGKTTYFEKPWMLLKFLTFFTREIVKCNLRVAYDVITPRNHMKPAIVAIPLEVTRDAEIALLANMLTLTPGTCSIDVSSDRRTLYVHAMYAPDPDALRRDIKQRYEKRVKELLR